MTDRPLPSSRGVQIDRLDLPSGQQFAAEHAPEVINPWHESTGSRVSYRQKPSPSIVILTRAVYKGWPSERSPCIPLAIRPLDTVREAKGGKQGGEAAAAQVLRHTAHPGAERVQSAPDLGEIIGDLGSIWDARVQCFRSSPCLTAVV